MQRGSDERQYCSPLINLPVCSFSRSKIYPEYHTSKDNLKIISQKGLQESLEVFKNIIDAFELGLTPKTKIFCEPNLGKRGLYPTLSKKDLQNTTVQNRTNLIAYSDGTNNIFKISKILNLDLQILLEEYKGLKKEKFFSRMSSPLNQEI